MQKYRRKPETVEAVLFTEENKYEVHAWVVQKQSNIELKSNTEGDSVLLIPKAGGTLICNIGSYVVIKQYPTGWREVQFMSMKDFQDNYTLVE